MRRCVLVLMVLAVACTATLGGMPAPAARAQQGAGETLAPTMLVLDASGSMREADPSGGTRMDAAKQALGTVVDGAPAGAQLGLMAYGTTPGKVANDLELGCQDINTLREVGPVDESGRQQLSTAIGQIDGHGYTPVGASLRAAAEELPAEGPRAIVLVSDGEDTCAPPPPCEVARDLKAQGVDLTMHTVGFQVGTKAREELRCIAEAGGGTYVDAPDAETLRTELPKIAERAWRNYQLDGEPIEGTAELDGAPEMGPGQYVDTIELDSTRWYRIDVPDGFTVHGSATLVIPRDETIAGISDLTLSATLTDRRGVACHTHEERWSQWTPMAAVSTSWNAEDGAECDPEGERYLRVEREGPREETELDLELQVILEPPVDGDTGPDGDSTELAFSSPGGEVRPVVGGGGFNDATELPTESAAYSDSIGYGEITTYRVWLDWGQAMAVRAHVGEGDLGPIDATRFEAQLHGPTRGGDWMDWKRGDVITDNEAMSLSPIEMPRVLYENRGNASYEDTSSALAGWHYITVWLLPEDSDADIPMEIEVSIDGEPVEAPAYQRIDPYPAAPVFDRADLEQGDSSGETDSSSPEASRGDDSEGASSSGKDGDGEERTASAAEESGPGALPWVLVGVGVILLAGVLAGVLLARSRRSRVNRAR